MRWLTDRTKLPPAGNWLLAGTLITTIGNALQDLAVAKLLFDRTGSARAFGAVLIFEQVLAFFTQGFAGPWVDRGDPRVTGMAAEFIRGSVICIASLMVMGSADALPWILLMSFAIRLANPFYKAATFALAPAVIPADQLVRFNALSNACLQSGQLLGVVLAGPVLLLVGGPGAFLLNGFSFVLSGLAVYQVGPALEEFERPTGKGSIWQQLIQGWSDLGQLVRREAGLGWHILLTSADNVGVVLFNLALVPPIVAEAMAGSPYWLSIVDGAFGVGAILSALIVERLTTSWGNRATIVTGIGGQGMCLAAMGTTTNRWITVLLAFGVGWFNTISWTVLMSSLQIRAKGPVKGRISTIRSLVIASVTITLVPGITRVASHSLAGSLAVSGAVCLAYALAVTFLGSPRRLGHKLLGETPPDPTIPN